MTSKKPMKNSTNRHELILKRLQENGRVMIEELSDLTRVSGVTIRKDLKLLEDKGLLFRTRGGGSISNPYTIERPINEKEFFHAKEKDLIAKAALTIIGDNDSIMIGSGTTVFSLARALHPSKRLTVITPAVKVTLELSSRPNIEVLQLGGLIRANSSSVAGAQAEHTLEDISCGILFLGVDGIDLDFGLSITNLAEANLNKKMIESAQVVAVLADSTKFGRRGLGKVCDFDQVRYIITDEGVSSGIVKQLDERGVKVIIASHP
jgi:DeoR family transcriptional regulator of aga operon